MSKVYTNAGVYPETKPSNSVHYLTHGALVNKKLFVE
jgi:hypothetical protein